MNVAIGDLYCQAIYYGDELIWALTITGEEYLNGEWLDTLIWNDNEIWNE